MTGISTLNRSPHASGFGHRAKRRRSPLLLNGANCLALFLLILASARLAGAQTLVVTSGGQPKNQGDTVSINTIPNMPNLVLSVSGGTSCDAFSYQISITYADQAGATTGTNVTFNAQDVVGDQSSTVNWAGNFEGGNATISWQLDGVQQSSFGFFINGTNPSNSTVDSYLSNGDGAWFKQNLVAYESGAYKYAPYNRYHQFVATPYDPVWGTPDGIGLMQLEPPNRRSIDSDFWSWTTNVADGLIYLDGLKSNAESFWNSQVTQWQADPAGPANPVPESVYTYCDFKYPPTGGDSYGDGNWMKAYNGAAVYFIFWNNSTAGSNPPNGHWVINDSAGYVNNVCTTPPL